VSWKLEPATISVTVVIKLQMVWKSTHSSQMINIKVKILLGCSPPFNSLLCGMDVNPDKIIVTIAYMQHPTVLQAVASRVSSHAYSKIVSLVK
jgi:hypothetical protein